MQRRPPLRVKSIQIVIDDRLVGLVQLAIDRIAGERFFPPQLYHCVFALIIRSHDLDRTWPNSRVPFVEHKRSALHVHARQHGTKKLDAQFTYRRCRTHQPDQLVGQPAGSDISSQRGNGNRSRLPIAYDKQCQISRQRRPVVQHLRYLATPFPRRSVANGTLHPLARLRGPHLIHVRAKCLRLVLIIAIQLVPRRVRVKDPAIQTGHGNRVRGILGQGLKDLHLSRAFYHLALDLAKDARVLHGHGNLSAQTFEQCLVFLG